MVDLSKGSEAGIKSDRKQKKSTRGEKLSKANQARVKPRNGTLNEPHVSILPDDLGYQLVGPADQLEQVQILINALLETGTSVQFTEHNPETSYVDQSTQQPFFIVRAIELVLQNEDSGDQPELDLRYTLNQLFDLFQNPHKAPILKHKIQEMKNLGVELLECGTEANSNDVTKANIVTSVARGGKANGQTQSTQDGITSMRNGPDSGHVATLPTASVRVSNDNNKSSDLKDKSAPKSRSVRNSSPQTNEETTVYQDQRPPMCIDLENAEIQYGARIKSERKTAPFTEAAKAARDYIHSQIWHVSGQQTGSHLSQPKENQMLGLLIVAEGFVRMAIKHYPKLHEQLPKDAVLRQIMCKFEGTRK